MYKITYTTEYFDNGRQYTCIYINTIVLHWMTGGRSWYARSEQWCLKIASKRRLRRISLARASSSIAKTTEDLGIERSSLYVRIQRGGATIWGRAGRKGCTWLVPCGWTQGCGLRLCHRRHTWLCQHRRFGF